MLPGFTIKQAMDFMTDFYESWNQDRADELLQFFKLNEEHRISTLSKGNTAKVNLLLGLAQDTDYVLMDEPFSGIDIFSREQIANVFTSHLIEDRGVIITTHEINDIEHLIDKVVVLNHGTVYKEFNASEPGSFTGSESIIWGLGCSIHHSNDWSMDNIQSIYEPCERGHYERRERSIDCRQLFLYEHA